MMAVRAIGAPALALAAALSAGGAVAQEMRQTEDGVIEPTSGFAGRMSMEMETSVPEEMAVTETIRFEPWQMLGDLFRDDLVFVMRGGPSNWASGDAEDAAPMACEAQRLLTERGQDTMRQLGALLVANELRPGDVLVSRWCRTQQTYAALEKGMLQTDMDALDGLTADVDPRLDLMGAAQGQEDAAGLREIIMEWDGGDGDGDGPLLVITHFPNIEALTEFRVYEGEMLIVDPKRDAETGGRVLGYMRLASATPDPVRFDPSVVTAEVELLE